MGLGGVFFLLLCSCSRPILPLQTVACSSGKEREGNVGSGHLIPKWALLLSRWWNDKIPPPFFRCSGGRGRGRMILAETRLPRLVGKRSCPDSCMPDACWSRYSLSEFGSDPLLFGKEKENNLAFPRLLGSAGWRSGWFMSGLLPFCSSELAHVPLASNKGHLSHTLMDSAAAFTL